MNEDVCLTTEKNFRGFDNFFCYVERTFSLTIGKKIAIVLLCLSQQTLRRSTTFMLSVFHDLQYYGKIKDKNKTTVSSTTLMNHGKTRIFKVSAKKFTNHPSTVLEAIILKCPGCNFQVVYFTPVICTLINKRVFFNMFYTSAN